MSEFHPEDYERKEIEAAGFSIRVTTYKLGQTFHCSVDNVSPGAVIARTSGAERASTEREAIELATSRLEISARRMEALRKLRNKE